MRFLCVSIPAADRMVMTDLLKAEEIKKALDAFAGWIGVQYCEKNIYVFITSKGVFKLEMLRPSNNIAIGFKLIPFIFINVVL